jgi:hypothetical protein
VESLQFLKILHNALCLRYIPSNVQQYATIRTGEVDEKTFKKILDFDQIDKEITLLGEELVAKHGKKLVDIPIYLSLYKHDSVDLTLIDLPGLVYDGDMGDLVRNMY